MFYSQSLEVLNLAKAIREALEDDCVEPRKLRRRPTWTSR